MDEENKEEREDRMTLHAAWFNLSNCAVGSGILSIPFAFAKMGIIFSVLVYIIITVTSWLGMYLLARTTTILATSTSQKSKIPRSYRDLIEIVMGRTPAILFQILIVVYCFSILVGYLMIIEDLISPVLRWLQLIGITLSESVHIKHVSLLSASIGFIFPISLIRTRSHFKYLSAGAILCVFYFVFLIIFESSVNPFRGVEQLPCWKHEHDVHLFNDFQSLIIGMPIICFALGGHLQSVSLFSELAFPYEDEMNESYLQSNERITKPWNLLRKWAIITILSMIFLTIIYVIIGCVSYVCMILPGRAPYGADILRHMIDADPYDGFIQSASLSIGLILLFSYPLFSFPLRAVIDEFVVWCLREPISKASRYNIETFFIVCCSYIVAVTVGDVKVIFGLVGAVGAVLQQFILPSILYLLVHKNTFYEEPLFYFLSIFVILVVGLVVGVAALFKILMYSATI